MHGVHAWVPILVEIPSACTTYYITRAMCLYLQTSKNVIGNSVNGIRQWLGEGV